MIFHNIYAKEDWNIIKCNLTKSKYCNKIEDKENPINQLQFVKFYSLTLFFK